MLSEVNKDNPVFVSFLLYFVPTPRLFDPPPPFINFSKSLKPSPVYYEPERNSQKGRFLRFSGQIGAKWEVCCSGCGLGWPVKCNIVGSKQKRYRLHELCKEAVAHLLHMVTKHKCGIETGDIHIFWTVYFIKRLETKEKRELDKKACRSEACESNVWVCERVEKVLRRVTHAQGNCVLVAGLLMLLYKSILLELLTDSH